MKLQQHMMSEILIPMLLAVAVLASSCGQPSEVISSDSSGSAGTNHDDGSVAANSQAGMPPGAEAVAEDQGYYRVTIMATPPSCSILNETRLKCEEPIPPGASVHVQIAKDSRFQDIVVDETCGDIKPQVLKSGEYYWRYRFEFSDRTSPWSVPKEFQVQQPIICIE